VFKIFLKHKKKKELRNTMMTAKKELTEEIFSESSEENLQKAIQKKVDAKKDMLLLRAKAFREIQSLLPQELMEKFKAKMKVKWSRGHWNKMARY